MLRFNTSGIAQQTLEGKPDVKTSFLGEGRSYAETNAQNCPHMQSVTRRSIVTLKEEVKQMAKKTERPAPHPDDFIIVAISLVFQAKPNPEVDDPPPFDAIEIDQTFTAADATEYLEKVVGAIRERRLYGLMLQEQAESAVGAGQWIKKTIKEVIAEATTENVAVRLPNVQRIKLRHDD